MRLPLVSTRYLLRCLWALSACVTGALRAAGDDAGPAAPVRIALVADADSQDLRALVAKELAGDAAIQLLARDVGTATADDGTRTRAPKDIDAAKPEKPVAADGLVFIRRGPDGPHLRLTAVGTGCTLLDEPIEGSSSAPALTAREMAHRVEHDAPRLKLPPGPVIPISVINLRAEYAANDAAATLERNLTLLLENRLASQPGYVVLERRHAAALNFERSLSPTPAALLPSAYIVDGTLSLPATAAKNMTVHLRLRSPGRPDAAADIVGSTDDLPTLAGQIADAIRQITGTAADAPPWPPAQEAHEYLLEGIWGEQHHANAAALEALDSAELLGETAADLPAARIPVLCALAAANPTDVMQRPPLTLNDDATLPPRLDAWERALRDTTRYTREKLEPGLQLLNHLSSPEGNTGGLGVRMTLTGCLLLRMLESANRPEAAAVRDGLRTFAGYDPLHGKLPADHTDATEYADDWSVSLDEELAYYRQLLTTYPWASGWGWQWQWHLDPDHFCPRFLPDMEARHAAFLDFFHGLLDDPVGRLTAMFDLTRWIDPSQRNDARRVMYDSLWDAREDLLTTGRLYLFVVYCFRMEKDQQTPVADPKLVALLRFELQRLDDFHESMGTTWYPELFPPAEAPGIWRDLQAYEKRYLALHPQSGGYFPSMNAAFIKRFGDPAAAAGPLPASPAPLAVTRFWYAKDAPRRMLLGSDGMCPAPDGVWLGGMIDGVLDGTDDERKSRGALYHVVIDPSLPDPFLAAPRINVPQASIQKTVVTPEAVYLLCLTNDRPQKAMVERYDLASRKWEEHETPGADRIFEAGGQLYLSLKGEDFDHREGGIARYDGRTGAMTLLASSRRRPAQNRFDDRGPYHVSDIFTGPGGKPCATIDFESTFIGDGPEAWAPLVNTNVLGHTRTEGARVLLYGTGSYKTRSDAAVMIDPARREPELWLGPLTALLRSNLPGAEKATADLPGWANASVWTQAEGDRERSNDYGFRDKDLFGLIRREKGAHPVELIWYRRGEKVPVHIPLTFAMDDAATAALQAVLPQNVNTFEMVKDPEKTPYVLSMTVIPQGICFKALMQGFWFLPFADVDHYLKTNAPPRP